MLQLSHIASGHGPGGPLSSMDELSLEDRRAVEAMVAELRDLGAVYEAGIMSNQDFYDRCSAVWAMCPSPLLRHVAHATVGPARRRRPPSNPLG